MRSNRCLSLALFAAGLFAPSVGLAQLMLPGAVGAPPPGSEAAPGAAASPAPKPKPVMMPTPGEASLAGRDLYLNGRSGGLTFGKTAGREPAITRLQLKGEQVSKPGEPCQVDVAAPTPIATHFAGKPAGLARYTAAIEACPFSFDVLDGAVLVVDAGQPNAKTCEWTAADCRVDPTGLWGPAGNGFSAEKTKELERARIRAESDMRANFRVLLHEAGKDKAAIKAIAGEQAGFSSNREMVCRDYLRESSHGFCALQLTQARSFALLARLSTERPKTRPKAKTPRKAAAPAASLGNP